MMKILLASTLVASALAASNNTESGPHSTCEPMSIDKFDDLGDKPYVSSSEIDSYNGVTHQGFVVITQSSAETVSGLTPVSPKNVVAINADPILLRPYGDIVASPSLAMDFHQFYFGCGTGNTPVSCNIVVRSYKRDMKQVSRRYFSYDPTTPAGLNMTLATLGGNGFRDLQKVTIGILSGNEVPSVTAVELYLDNVAHCNHER